MTAGDFDNAGQVSIPAGVKRGSSSAKASLTRSTRFRTGLTQAGFACELRAAFVPNQRC